MRRALPLALLIAALAPGAAHAATATVVRVPSAGAVQVRGGGHVRTFSLLGVDAPAPGACHGAAAVQALRQLLPRHARVKLVADPAGPRAGRYVYRGRRLVNAALLQDGDARAGATAGLKLAGRLSAAQQAAQQAGRGLWSECAPPPAPPAQAPPPGNVTGDAAIQRARSDLSGRTLTHIATTTFSSAQSDLSFCSDGSFIEDVSTYSDFGGSTAARYTGRWTVLTAEYHDGGASARVQRDNADGTQGFLDIVVAGTQVTVNGAVDSVARSAVCS